MKIPYHNSSPTGFTLIELLVVITIIATLAAAGFSVGPTLINKAKKTSGLATASSISMAVEQYYTEYSALPAGSDSASEATTLDTTSSGVNVLKILAGDDFNGQNPRKIRFLSVKEAKNNIDGAVYDNSGKISKIYDPWGQPYYIRLDYDYDEKLEFDPTPSKIPSITLNGRRVAVYSHGVRSDNDADDKTMIKTW